MRCSGASYDRGRAYVAIVSTWVRSEYVIVDSSLNALLPALLDQLSVILLHGSLNSSITYLDVARS